MPKFTLNAIQNFSASDDFLQLRAVQPALAVQEYVLNTTRSADAKPVTIDLKDDDLMILEMDNGVAWHYRADDFNNFLLTQPLAKRSGKDDGTIELPDVIIGSSTTRSAGDFIKTKALKVITGLAAKKTAVFLAEKMEAPLKTGVHGLNKELEFIPFNKSDVISGKPYLLFIHGTNSSTSGAFGELKNNAAYQKLFDKYEGRVLAFEHKTLSESPLRNLQDLLLAFSDIAIQSDIICHSRGGIVADLLARCSNGELPFNDEEKQIIDSNEDFKTLRTEVKTVNALAKKTKITVGKMVRVACPSAGTVLIDTRLDNLVNVLCNLLKLIPGAATCMPFTLFLDFAKAVVHERTDIEVFPGIAAQIPGSPLLRMLNNPGRQIRSELYVISGDVERGSVLNTMVVMATNLYFGQAHDFVVNSNSMFRGTYRSTVVKEHFEQEPGVNHFNYFKNKKSQDAILAALVNNALVPQFYTDIGITSEITIVHKRGLTGKKPVVFLLPGIMGSHLQNKNDQRLWLNYFGIATGILTKLEINQPDISAAGINAGNYAALTNFLSNDFDVIPFAYDWRKDLTDAGKKLLKEVKTELSKKERINKEVHFIAHSMGGLVLRSMITADTGYWKEITAGGKTKVLMMGVPNEGSHSIIRLLLGKDSVVKKLALLDIVHRKNVLLDIFKEYPGVMQLLPKNEQAIFTEAEWKQLSAANNEYTGSPSGRVLKKGKDFFSYINTTEFDNNIFRYIAGQDDQTPAGYLIKNNAVEFTAAAEGDGRVLWSSIPPALSKENIYYVKASHGDIASFEDAFDGYRELLQTGSTSETALSKTAPSFRGTDVLRSMPDSDVVIIPSEQELSTGLLSFTTTVKKAKPGTVVNVSVINGDLVHSKYPVVVGHFKGDGIVQAEKYLDKALNGKLSEYHYFNNYPGNIGTHLVILKDDAKALGNMACNGGVVVGLGEFGSLTENRLLLSLTQALLTLAIKHSELENKLGNMADDAFGISSLLIGSDFAGLRINTSVKTVLMAVKQVNERLEAMSAVGDITKIYPKITQVQLVEIYQHKAIQTARILNGFLKEDAFSQFRFVPSVITQGSGALKIIPDDNQADNWHRLEVVVDKSAEKEIQNNILPLSFTSITDRAHASEEAFPVNKAVIEILIQKLSRNQRWDKTFSQTLYELLIPNSFKGYSTNLRNLVLLVDEQTARYPWELLHDANGISEKPLVINTGIVRQLKTGNQRTNIIMNSSNNALVIGNPDTEGSYPNLLSAENEAGILIKKFTENGMLVTDSVKEKDITVIQKLHSEYKIIHIASHGVVGENENEPTGVVIGKDMVYTASDFDKIRIVPEFVFINCCSSNQYNEEKIRKSGGRKYELAATVGTQLIEMGVKAAIVTGWEIEDTAASVFAAAFYNSMFEGKTFGDAVRDAREKIYTDYGQTNTWGAYQCYGDPFYTFPMRSKSSWSAKTFYTDKIEAEYAIDNLKSQATSGSKRQTFKEAEAKLNSIINALSAEWKNDGRIIELLADLCNKLNAREQALEYYPKLAAVNDGNYTVYSVLQFHNLSIRQLQDQFKNAIEQFKEKQQLIKNTGNTKAKKIKDEKKLLQEIDALLKRTQVGTNKALNSLIKMEVTTEERLCLIAAGYRRLYDYLVNYTELVNGFVFTKTKTAVNHQKFYEPLIKAADFYRQAFELTQKSQGSISYYPYFNWLHLSVLLASMRFAHKHLAAPSNYLLTDEALKDAEQKENTNPGFFNSTAFSSAQLAKLIMATPVKKTKNKEAGIDLKTFEDAIYQNFTSSWAKDGAASQADSFINYLQFIKSLLSKSGIIYKHEKAEAVNRIIKKIEPLKK
jgi:CHAT domain-containing protein